MSDDEDWFERALRDSGEERDGESAPERESGTAGAESAEEGESTPEGAGEGDAETGGEEEDGLFEDDFATAFGEADTGAEGKAGGGADGESPFGGGGEFGMSGGAAGETGGEGGPFGGGGGEFGMGEELDMGGGEELGEEEFESELARIDLGVEGLDDMIRGGVPERSLMAVIGSAGTGKTTFGLQFLNRGLENGRQAIYITLEESRQRILDSASEKGWDFEEHAAEGRLAVVDIDPVEMANNLTSIRSDLPTLVEDFGAERLVLDSVSLLELMYEDRAKRRNEVYEFTRTLKESGVTTLLTSEAAEDNPYASRHGIVEYLTDAVFIMRYVRPSDFRETRLAIEIQKIRDANHSREMKPYEITDEGLNVYRQANIF